MRKEGPYSGDYIDKLKGLEILRFVLALAVIIWHYQHFFQPFGGDTIRNVYLNEQPFYSFFELFYTQGYYAVQIFWMISGVIFYNVYQKRIYSREVSFGKFVLNRFSRLYPLHLLTLFLVLALQSYYFSREAEYFVYSSNSPQRFFQNVLFIQAWGLHKFSFNGPAWSVSTEILVYLLFFFFCMAGFLDRFRNLLLSLAFFMMIEKWDLLFASNDLSHKTNDINTCFYFFFAGCVFIKLIDLLRWRTASLYLLLTTFVFLAVVSVYTPSFILPIFRKITGRLSPDLLFISASTILGFMLLFNLRIFNRIPLNVFRFWGNMTYSTYLIHFPVQLLMFLFLKPLNYHVFFSPVIFTAYLLLSFGLGRIIYVYFEVPCQNLIRRIAGSGLKSSNSLEHARAISNIPVVYDDAKYE